jgi:type II secretory pathway pseudopilin PulG
MTKAEGRTSEHPNGQRRPVRAAAASRSDVQMFNCSAFTLTEILIVIGLIVLLIALAVPAFNLISGGRSIEGATNNISAALGRARAEAIGFQRPAGILFYMDPKSDRCTMVIVSGVNGPEATGDPGDPDVYLDLAEADAIPLPVGIVAHTINNLDTNITNPDRYIGFNTFGHTAPPTPQDISSEVPYGGVVLFDGTGRLASLRYAFRGRASDPDNPGQFIATRLGGLLKVLQTGPPDQYKDFMPANMSSGITLRSQLGFVLFDRDGFNTNNGDATDPRITGGLPSPYNVREQAEENWIDTNSTPLLVNRYNGTLVKGE